MEVMKVGLLLILLLCAALSDVKAYRIRNELIVIGLLTGAVFRTQENGVVGLLYLIPDLCIPVLLMYLAYKMHGLGAADIKIVCVISTYEGMTNSLTVLCLGLILAVLWGILLLGCNRQLGEQCTRLVNYLLQIFQGNLVSYPADKATVLPLSIFIFFAYLLLKGSRQI